MSYTTFGEVRGYCGHNHETIKTAEACIDLDAISTKKVGGYTDRCVIHCPYSPLDREALSDLSALIRDAVKQYPRYDV